MPAKMSMLSNLALGADRYSAWLETAAADGIFKHEPLGDHNRPPGRYGRSLSN
jgi:hypothetical protein